MTDVDDDLRNLLRDKADEIRTDPAAPPRVLQRARRRRIGNALVASATTLAVAAGAFLGVRAVSHETRRPPSQTTQETRAHQVWLTMNHHLFVTTRDTQGTPEAAMQALLDGPTPDETGATVASSIPQGTDLQGLSVHDGTADVQLSTGVESDPLADAQVVYTLTQFPDVARVLINN